MMLNSIHNDMGIKHKKRVSPNTDMIVNDMTIKAVEAITPTKAPILICQYYDKNSHSARDSWMLLIENERFAYQYHLQLIVQLQVMVVNPIGYLTLALTNMLPMIFNSLSIRYPTKDPTIL